MSEEQLRQMNTRIEVANDLLKRAKKILDYEFVGYQSEWQREYQQYLKSFKSKES